MKRSYWIIAILIGILLLWFFIRFLVGGNEDGWVKDSRGIWIKHGNPREIPNYVLDQQQVVSCALNLYKDNETKINFSSQCLGTCGDYAIDIVHVPRISEDNLIENQCSDFSDGKVSQFIELDKNGEIVRIV